MTTPVFKNPHRISVVKFRESEGLADERAFNDYMGQLVCDSVAPAMCDEACTVEPDGHCQHGCPSILLALGII